MLQKGCFPIKSWHSNHTEIYEEPGEKEVGVLGLRWTNDSDEISLKPKEITELKIVTKRTVLGLVSKFWDPLGLLNPSIIKYKISLQRLLAEGYDWDAQLQVEIEDEWRRNRQEMTQLFECRISRCLKPEGAAYEPQLLGFSDARNLAYGACCFIRWTVKPSEYAVQFIASKALVAPLKKRSIPRLKLM